MPNRPSALLSRPYLPLKLFVSYIAFTMVLTLYGPVTYANLRVAELVAYMTGFLMLFSLGYVAGIAMRGPMRYASRPHLRGDGLQIVKACIAVSFLYKCQELASLVATGGFDLSLEAVGHAYVDYYSDYVRGSGQYSLAYVVSIFFYLPLQIALILGFYEFRRLPKAYKALLLATVVLVVLVNVVGQGKQKQFGDVLVFALSVLLLNMGAVQGPKSSFRLATVAVSTVGLLVLMLVLYSRYSALEIDVANINKVTHPLLDYDPNHPVFLLLGDTAGLPVAIFCMYLTMGYQGLSLSFDQPFVWTYGVGNSYALTILLDKVIGLPVSVHGSYPYRVGAATGWDEAKWHTVFSWLASDLTFAGVLVLFFVVAFVYAQCWQAAVTFGDRCSIVLFAVLTLGLIFVPANNQLLHTPESFLSLAIIFYVWVARRAAPHPLVPDERLPKATGSR